MFFFLAWCIVFYLLWLGHWQNRVGGPALVLHSLETGLLNSSSHLSSSCLWDISRMSWWSVGRLLQPYMSTTIHRNGSRYGRMFHHLRIIMSHLSRSLITQPCLLSSAVPWTTVSPTGKWGIYTPPLQLQSSYGNCAGEKVFEYLLRQVSSNPAPHPMLSWMCGLLAKLVELQARHQAGRKQEGKRIVNNSFSCCTSHCCNYAAIVLWQGGNVKLQFR